MTTPLQQRPFSLVAWRHPDGILQGRPYILDDNGDHVCEGYLTEESVDTMETMVLAVNCHDDLLAACRLAICAENDRRAGLQLSDSDFAELHAALHSAIAKATGSQ